MTGVVEEVGPDLVGSGKYHCAAVAKQFIYALPYGAQRMLRLEIIPCRARMSWVKTLELVALAGVVPAAASVDSSAVAFASVTGLPRDLWPRVIRFLSG